MKRGSVTRQRSFANSKKTRIFLIGVLILVVTWLWFRYNQMPAEGVINNNVVSQGEKKLAEPQKGHYSGSIIGFDYPGNYSSIQNNAPSGLIVEQLSIAANAGTQDSRRLSVTVKQFGTGVIMEEDAAYKVRMQDSENYNYEVATIAGNPGRKFIKTDKTEVTYFVKGPSYYAIFSGTATGGSQGLADDMSQIVNSFSWQK